MKAAPVRSEVSINNLAGDDADDDQSRLCLSCKSREMVGFKASIRVVPSGGDPTTLGPREGMEGMFTLSLTR